MATKINRGIGSDSELFITQFRSHDDDDDEGPPRKCRGTMNKPLSG